MIKRFLIISTILFSAGYSQVTVSPTQLDFGSTSIGTTISIELTINNGTSELLQITGVTSTDNQFYAPTPVANIAAFGSDQFTINFVAITNGASSATLTLETSNENFATIDIPCTGFGASDISGDVDGIWALSNSPFNIVGDIFIPNGETLLIEPGVEVINWVKNPVHIYCNMPKIRFIGTHGMKRRLVEQKKRTSQSF